MGNEKNVRLMRAAARLDLGLVGRFELFDTELFISVLESKSGAETKMRKFAAFQLALSDEPRQYELLIDTLLHDSDKEVRCACVYGLLPPFRRVNEIRKQMMTDPKYAHLVGLMYTTENGRPSFGLPSVGAEVTLRREAVVAAGREWLVTDAPSCVVTAIEMCLLDDDPYWRNKRDALSMPALMLGGIAKTRESSRDALVKAMMRGADRYETCHEVCVAAANALNGVAGVSEALINAIISGCGDDLVESAAKSLSTLPDGHERLVDQLMGSCSASVNRKTMIVKALRNAPSPLKQRLFPMLEDTHRRGAGFPNSLSRNPRYCCPLWPLYAELVLTLHDYPPAKEYLRNELRTHLGFFHFPQYVIDYPEHLQTVVEVISEKMQDQGWISEILWVIMKMPPTEPLLKRLMTEPQSSQVREAAGKRLGHQPEMRNWLAERLGDSRCGKAAACGLAQSEEGIGMLMQALDNPSAQIRASACTANIVRSPDVCIGRCMKLLGHQESAVRLWAASALRRSSLPEVLVTLIDLIGDEDEEISERAVHILDEFEKYERSIHKKFLDRNPPDKR